MSNACPTSTPMPKNTIRSGSFEHLKKIKIENSPLPNLEKYPGFGSTSAVAGHPTLWGFTTERKSRHHEFGTLPNAEEIHCSLPADELDQKIDGAVIFASSQPD